MKRILSALLMALILIASQSLFAQAQDQKNASVLIDGLSLNLEVLPIIQNDRILVPFRAIAEDMNIDVSWDNQTRAVNATDGNTTVRLQIDNRTAYRNNTPMTLDVAPQIIDGRTLIPLRFFSETFNCQVYWNDTIHQVSIITPRQAMTVIGFYALGDSKTSSWTNLFGHTYPTATAGNTDVISELALGWYSIDKQGNLLDRSRTGWQRPDGWETVLNSAKQYKLSSEMVIHVTDGDGTISLLLNDPIAITRTVKAVSEEAKHYSGVNLDFEGLGFNDSGEQLKQVQQRFTSFVKLLDQELKTNSTGLTLTLHAPNSAYPGYDYQALGQIADRIIIMAYDYGSKPEPVNLVKQAVEMACKSVPANKLILGISAPSETAESIATKVGIAKRYNLGGVALWRLGVINDGMWQKLRDSLIANRQQ
ncbi:MAG: copper amine oxidase [Firmicutes bacterium HGW-Firmicutes-15]|nr:MAG: copper amine oxidase [Firmicutes bacterium HGW-Firmicutes-15]